jgi:hypothetical protein
MIYVIKKENILWFNDKIRGRETCVDLEVSAVETINSGDLVKLPSETLAYVRQSKFSRFENMPKSKMGGQVIRIMPISNEKLLIE